MQGWGKIGIPLEKKIRVSTIHLIIYHVIPNDIHQNPRTSYEHAHYFIALMQKKILLIDVVHSSTTK